MSELSDIDGEVALTPFARLPGLSALSGMSGIKKKKR